MERRRRLRPYAIAALGLAVAAPALWPPPFRLTDHIFFWYTGRLYLGGGSPYDGSAWIDAATRYDNVNLGYIVDLNARTGGTIWAYPPWTGYLFVPFGALPIDVGLWTLHIAYLAVALGAAVALARLFRAPDWRVLALSLAALPVFQPFIYAERSGHFAAFLLAGAVLALYGMLRRSRWRLVAGAVLLATKPQVAPLFAIAVLAFLVRQHRWRDIAWTTGVLLAVATASIALHPDSLAAMSSGGRERLSLIGPGTLNPVPNAWTLAAVVVGSGWPLLGAALVTAVGAALWLASARAAPAWRPAFALTGALVLSLFATPYVFSYDHLLLLPAAFVCFAAADPLPRAARLAQLVLALAIVLVLPWLAFFVGVGSDDHGSSGVVPLFFAALLVSAALATRLPRAPAAAS